MKLFKDKFLQGTKDTLIAGERPAEMSVNISKSRLKINLLEGINMKSSNMTSRLSVIAAFKMLLSTGLTVILLMAFMPTSFSLPRLVGGGHGQGEIGIFVTSLPGLEFLKPIEGRLVSSVNASQIDEDGTAKGHYTYILADFTPGFVETTRPEEVIPSEIVQYKVFCMRAKPGENLVFLGVKAVVSENAFGGPPLTPVGAIQTMIIVMSEPTPRMPVVTTEAFNNQGPLDSDEGETCDNITALNPDKPLTIAGHQFATWEEWAIDTSLPLEKGGHLKLRDK